MSTNCEICGSPAVDIREALAFRGVPLGVFKVRKCLGLCREEVFSHAAWRAIEAIEKTLEAARNPLLVTTSNTFDPAMFRDFSLDVNSLDLSAPAPLALAGVTSPTVRRSAAAPLLGSSY